MRITKIHIENFRCLRDFMFCPREDINVIIGENNSGKSALLQALDRALGRGSPTFELEDFFVDAPNVPPQALPVMRIDLKIGPAPAADFSPAFTADFVDEIDFDADGRPFLTYRTEAAFDAVEGRVRVEYFTLKADGTTRRLPARKRFALRGYVPFYLADAFRDILRELRNRRGFWGRLVDSILLDPNTAAAVDVAIRDINTTILSATPRLAEIRDRFREVGRIVPTAPPPDDVIVNPVPVDPSMILRNLEVFLRTLGAPRGFALDRHGEGTRSIAYLVIFRAFVELLAREENNNAEAEPILGIEEPEVHLHPHARRAVATMVAGLGRQTFMTTHSTAVTRQISVHQVTLLRRVGPGCVASQIPSQSPANPAQPFFEPRERSVLEGLLRAGAAEVVFARAVILFEGESELRAVPIFARAIGIDLNLHGISLVPVNGKAYTPLLRMLGPDALNIPWVILSDGENLEELAGHLVKAGRINQATVDAAIAAGRLAQDVLLVHDCFAFDRGYDLEAALIYGGALAEYETAIARLIATDALAKFLAAHPALGGQPRQEQVREFMKAERWGKKFKPMIAEAVADSITASGTDASRIPTILRSSLSRAYDFATGAAVKV